MMASSRDYSLGFTNPSSSSSPITVSSAGPLDSYLSDPAAAGSFQNDGGLLGDGGDTSGSSNSDLEFGYSRPDFWAVQQLAGTVELSLRHVFLCYKNAHVSPRKSDIKKQTRLIICEGHDGTKTSNGDVLIFPDMVRYRTMSRFTNSVPRFRKLTSLSVKSGNGSKTVLRSIGDEGVSGIPMRWYRTCTAKLPEDVLKCIGGEPTVWKDFEDICFHLSNLKGLQMLAMTTNGLTLAAKLPRLKEGGLTSLNISLDSLVQAKFEFLTRRRGHHKVLESINTAVELDYNPVKFSLF